MSPNAYCPTKQPVYPTPARPVPAPKFSAAVVPAMLVGGGGAKSYKK